MSGLIALLTDFGHDDPYAGVMRGVLFSRAPQARVADLCHGVPPHDVRAAALCLRSAIPYYPEDTLFVCVVDPGVGSKRAVLWARGRRHSYLAPDNGLLTLAAEEDPFLELRVLANRSLRLPRPSATFHGRDVFAPAAAALACGLSPARLGPKRRSFVRLPWPRPRRMGGRLVGEVVLIDRFGNAVTNLAGKGLKELRARGVRAPLVSCYADAERGAPLALVGSFGYVELCIREGSFAAKTGIQAGEAVYAG